LRTLVEEILPMTSEQTTSRGIPFVIGEVLLVHDCGPDRSEDLIELLSTQYSFVRPVWLSRNYGQHAATLAGMASAAGDWVATIDEDGQQDPKDLSGMLDAALFNSLQLVYAHPVNPPPHGWFRNLSSRIAKVIAGQLLGNKTIGRFNSFRLVDGEIARTLAAYCGHGVYLDVGLFWITGRIGHSAVKLREERGRSSGYSYLTLLRHFWHLILTTGTRPLRLITIMGFASVILSVAVSVFAIVSKIYLVTVPGWTSLLVVVALFSGCILTALGVIAEYLAVTMGIVMGKPLYVIATKPTRQAPDQLQ
jgi:polyisoprenyl-phosphate glycosyltransferase